MTDRAPQTQDKFVLRLPEGMRDRIRAAAEANGRSMNAELVSVLENYYPPLPTLEDLKLSLDMLKSDLRKGAGKSDHWLMVTLEDISRILAEREGK